MRTCPLRAGPDALVVILRGACTGLLATAIGRPNLPDRWNAPLARGNITKESSTMAAGLLERNAYAPATGLER